MNYMILDTETTNNLDCPMCYDIGWTITNEVGNVIATKSYVVKDIFNNVELMKSAYFQEKIPQYIDDITNGKRILASLFQIRKNLAQDLDNYKVKDIYAHNSRFDMLSLRTTLRYLTKSKYRYFLPYNQKEIKDTLKYSKEILKNNQNYIDFCHKNNYLTQKNQLRFTAEIIYRFLTNNNDFVESHTGLEDTLIEKEILLFCLKNKPNFNASIWG